MTYSILPPISTLEEERKLTPPELMSRVFSVRLTRRSPTCRICSGSSNSYRCARRCSKDTSVRLFEKIINGEGYHYPNPCRDDRGGTAASQVVKWSG